MSMILALDLTMIGVDVTTAMTMAGVVAEGAGKDDIEQACYLHEKS